MLPFHHLLRDHRVRTGEAQKAVAAFVGVSQPIYNDWERNVRRPRQKEHLERLAEWLELPLPTVVLLAYDLDPDEVEPAGEARGAMFEEAVAAAMTMAEPALRSVLADQLDPIRADLETIHAKQEAAEHMRAIDREIDQCLMNGEHVPRDLWWRWNERFPDAKLEDDESTAAPRIVFITSSSDDAAAAQTLALAARSGKPAPGAVVDHDRVLAELEENPPVDAPRDDPARKGRRRAPT